MNTISDLKMQIMLNPNTAFFTSIMLNLDIIAADIPTADVDGKQMRFNVTWLKSLTKKQAEFVMVHELCHIIYKHAYRLDTRDFDRFNVACDHAINLYLTGSCGYPIIEGCLCDQDYSGMSAEQIYAVLPIEPKQDNFIGSDLLESTGTPEDSQYIDDLLVQAVQCAKAGTVPEDIARYIEELLNPILPWDVLLDKYLAEKQREDYSYKRINKRYTDVILPTLYSEQLGTVSVYVDLSGSVSDKQATQYISEFTAIKEKLNPTLLEVVTFNTKIIDVFQIQAHEVLDIKLSGGGGTKLTEVANRINESDSEINILFTDGHYTPVTYDKEVLHIIVGNPKYTNTDHPVIHIGI